MTMLIVWRDILYPLPIILYQIVLFSQVRAITSNFWWKKFALNENSA